MTILKKYKSLIFLCFAFGVFYSLISLVNHYNFRTYALDLGLYTNAAYKYAHLQVADSLMIKDFFESILGGHLDFYLILLSPFTYLFGTYTLLIFQILAIIMGGVGIHHYFRTIGCQNSKISILATLYFFLFFGIFGALSFDYHSVVVASCLTPWFFSAIHSHKKALAAWLLFFILISQENVPLWLCFVCLGLAIEYRRDANKVKFILILSAVSLVYFILAVSVVIPFFSAQEQYGGFLYSSLGSNLGEAFLHFILRPIDSLGMLFTNHNESLHGDYVKLELFLILMFSGFPLLFAKPQYILMLIPIFFQKLFHDSPLMWGIGHQYNIEFAPIMAIGIFSVISSFKNERLSRALAIVLPIMAIGSTFRTMDNTISFTDKSRIRIYKKSHYQRDYDVKAAHDLLSTIPKDAKVSAQSPFVPHLVLRKHIYQFPIIADADYIIYSKYESSYPITPEEFDSITMQLEQSAEWEISQGDGLTILKRVVK